MSAVPHDLRPVFQANRKGKGKGQNGHTSPHMHPNLASDGICNWIIFIIGLLFSFLFLLNLKLAKDCALNFAGNTL